MLSSMAPTIAWKEGSSIALGGRGGSLIPTATLQVILNYMVDGDSLQMAVNRPRIHHQWLPDQISIEQDSLAPETQMALEALGHAIEVKLKQAKVNAVAFEDGGRLTAAADPRGPGVAGVVRREP